MWPLWAILAVGIFGDWYTAAVLAVGFGVGWFSGIQTALVQYAQEAPEETLALLKRMGYL